MHVRSLSDFQIFGARRPAPQNLPVQEAEEKKLPTSAALERLLNKNNDTKALKAFRDAYNTFTSEKSSTADKAKALIDIVATLAQANGGRVPEEAAKVLNNLDPGGSLSRVLKGALTLFDKNASLKDRAVALFDLAVGGDDGHATLKSLDGILSKTDMLEAEKALIKKTARETLGMEPKKAKLLTEALFSFGPKTRNQLLGDRNSLKALTKMVANLPEKLRGPALDFVSKMDSQGLKVFLRMAGQIDGKILGKALKTLEDLGLDGRHLGKVLQAADGVMAKVGGKLTAKVFGKVLKGLAKMVPAVGAVPAFHDAYRMGVIAKNAKNPDIKTLAGVTAAVNGADGVLAVLEAFGIGNIGLPANIAFAGVELVLGLVTESLYEREQQQGVFKSPKALRLATTGFYAAQGPTGWGAMVGLYGAQETGRRLTEMGNEAGKIGKQVLDELYEQAKEAGTRGKLALEMLGQIAHQQGTRMAREAEKMLDKLRRSGPPDALMVISPAAWLLHKLW